jgi:hypothetical protein
MAQLQPRHFNFTRSAGEWSGAIQADRVGPICIHPSRKSASVNFDLVKGPKGWQAENVEGV